MRPRPGYCPVTRTVAGPGDGCSVSAGVSAGVLILLCRILRVMAMSEAPPTRPPKSEVRQRGKILGLRCLPDEERAIRRAAEARGLSVAAFLRDAALRAVSP